MASKVLLPGGYVEELVKKIQDNGFEATLLGGVSINDVAKEDRDLALRIREYKVSRTAIKQILTEEYAMDLS